MDVTSNDVICNGGINPYHQPISAAIIKAAAGSQVTAEWHHSMRLLSNGLHYFTYSPLQLWLVLIRVTRRTLLIQVTRVSHIDWLVKAPLSNIYQCMQDLR